jgi:BirA family biotin operon repressor/biotin-[acetyl-CoA-carboxylase] ligase
MDELSTAALSAVLTTRRLGRPSLIFTSVKSTNDIAYAEGQAGAPEGLLVLAEEQTAGRGRLERTWWAPPRTCLLMSLLLRPSLPLAAVGQLTMCLGLGAVEGIREVTGVQAALKWPNDLLFGRRKLGGILTELNTAEGGLNYAVLGLGLNVNVDFTTATAPAELRELAASLGTEIGRPVNRTALLAAILAHTERWYDRALDGNSPYMTWTQHLDTLQRRVRVSLLTGSLEGVAVGVSADGALLVQDDAGLVHTVWSGDVTAVR